MDKQAKNAQSETAAYGSGLLCNRGGWTLLEMLGSDYEKLSGINEIPFSQKDFQESLDKVSGRVQSPSVAPKKKS
jgi:hypothetical protein